MTLHNFTTAAVLGLAMTMNACSGEMQTMAPTHVAQISLAPTRYGELVAKLDIEMKAVGLSRRGASPGLKELRGRDVLFYVYELERSNKKVFVGAFISITDIKKAGTVDMEVYSAVFADEKLKKDAMSRVQKLLAEYGAGLTERPADAEKKPTN
jgi:hypothetical protein